MIESIILILLAYLLKNERDMCRTNFKSSLTYKILPKTFIEKHRLWLKGNLWNEALYQKYKLINLPLPDKWEWFLAKNVLTFLNDYWKWNEFWLMWIVCYAIALISGLWWLVFPYYVIGGALHSILDTSLFRFTNKKE